MLVKIGFGQAPVEISEEQINKDCEKYLPAFLKSMKLEFWEAANCLDFSWKNIQEFDYNIQFARITAVINHFPKYLANKLGYEIQ